MPDQVDHTDVERIDNERVELIARVVIDVLGSIIDAELEDISIGQGPRAPRAVHFLDHWTKPSLDEMSPRRMTSRDYSNPEHR
jgi:hypothetical protein